MDFPGSSTDLLGIVINPFPLQRGQMRMLFLFGLTIESCHFFID